MQIFKVQLPLLTNDPEPMALAYDQTKSRGAKLPLAPVLVRAMHGRAKAFFWGERVFGDQSVMGTVVCAAGVAIDFAAEAPWQSW